MRRSRNRIKRKLFTPSEITLDHETESRVIKIY